jgi:hypothetical protein
MLLMLEKISEKREAIFNGPPPSILVFLQLKEKQFVDGILPAPRQEEWIHASVNPIFIFAGVLFSKNAGDSYRRRSADRQFRCKGIIRLLISRTTEVTE